MENFPRRSLQVPQYHDTPNSYAAGREGRGMPSHTVSRPRELQPGRVGKTTVGWAIEGTPIPHNITVSGVRYRGRRARRGGVAASAAHHRLRRPPPRAMHVQREINPDSVEGE